jgi:hypothetical protein
MSDQELTMAQVIEKMMDIRDERRRISARDKELIDEWRSLEFEAIKRLDDQDMEKASSKKGTITITETVLPQVVDWDDFYAYIVEHDAFHLLQKRPTAAAFRELNESGEKVAGVEPYTQRSIGLRKK